MIVEYGSVLWYVIISLADTVFVFGVAAVLVRIGKTGVLVFFGRYSLQFFMLHVFFAHNIHLFTGLYCQIDDWSRENAHPGASMESLLVLLFTIALVIGYIKLGECIRSFRKNQTKGGENLAN